MNLEFLYVPTLQDWLKVEFTNFLIRPSVASKYNIIWTEKGDMIDSFIPEILTIKECLKRVQLLSITCWTRFERSLNINIFGMKRFDARSSPILADLIKSMCLYEWLFLFRICLNYLFV